MGETRGKNETDLPPLGDKFPNVKKKWENKKVIFSSHIRGSVLKSTYIIVLPGEFWSSDIISYLQKLMIIQRWVQMGSDILPLKISQDHSSLGKIWLFYFSSVNWTNFSIY
jgi:hypothetical protein